MEINNVVQTKYARDRKMKEKKSIPRIDKKKTKWNSL